jgi:hypothetical protein
MASTTLISTTSFGSPTGNYDGSSSTFVSKQVKGDGYLGFTDGLHTVAWKITEFSGEITVQATLEKTPAESDWFDVRLLSNTQHLVNTSETLILSQVGTSVYSTPTTESKTYNFLGNFVWVRVRISEFSAGTINFVQVNS